jgi:5'-nucleotidase
LKIILTNDDGIDAPGLENLTQIVSSITVPTVVAPQAAQSGVGHRVTCRFPIAVERRSDSRYSVKGTPADCVRLAIRQFAPDADWVIAGINAGANLGSDVYQSGTVAAAREAAILGVKAIAISQYIARDHQIDWELTRIHAEAVLRLLLKKALAAHCYWNVNLPHPLTRDVEPTAVFCGLDRHPHKYTYRRQGDAYHYEGTIHERPRQPGKDVAVCFGGNVAITQLTI